MKNVLKSICTIEILIIMGGILVTIGEAIFEPTYTYPSIGIFIISFLIGGVAFVVFLVFLVSMIMAVNMLLKILKQD